MTSRAPLGLRKVWNAATSTTGMRLRSGHDGGPMVRPALSFLCRIQPGRALLCWGLPFSSAGHEGGNAGLGAAGGATIALLKAGDRLCQILVAEKPGRNPPPRIPPPAYGNRFGFSIAFPGCCAAIFSATPGTARPAVISSGVAGYHDPVGISWRRRAVLRSELRRPGMCVSNHSAYRPSGWGACVGGAWHDRFATAMPHG